MNKTRLTQELKAEALRLGFDRAGACPAVAPPGRSHFQDWLAAGYAGQMQFFQRRAAAYDHPENVLDGARSLLMLSVNYRTEAPRPTRPGQGRISRYAWGEADYHDEIHSRLKDLGRFVHKHVPEARVRGVVDTAPLLEHEFARLAGLGWTGKNTLLLDRQAGSWFFLAALLTDLELDYDQPLTTDHCGTCTACLDACPTGAFPQPYVLDARRCISYLTFELREAIPAGLRESLGDWLFGCDVCQEVCPWNRRAPASRLACFSPQTDRNPTGLAELFFLTDEAFRTRFRRTPLWRAKRRGILRNAAIVLGNRPAADAVPALTKGLCDPEPLIREACAWALGRYDSPVARTVLSDRIGAERDDGVRREILAALG
jgi:epoxyqueuosine reductase